MQKFHLLKKNTLLKWTHSTIRRFNDAKFALASYKHLEIESKWQSYWDQKNTFQVIRREGKPKKYILDMFPYPSGAGLHVGHPEGYTATDIMSRYYRMKDYDVLHPMGWDAFGLPAEQHAINTGTHPAVTTYQNIATFKRQLKSIGFSYDWSRELSTTDEDYFKWTQWIFLKLFKAGLASQSEVPVNWCPALGTVLANEEVINGLSERGGHPVTRLPLRQWILHIGVYNDRLEADLNGLQWPEGTLSAQKQWIGRSEGASIKFTVDGISESFEVFTTRPDTLMGVTYVVLAPEHPLVTKLASSSHLNAVKDYQEKVSKKSDLERQMDKSKTGVFLGSYAIHPLTNEKIPIWIADYVLSSYGTGAVMAVPAHDERDYHFAKSYDLPIKQVIDSVGNESNITLPFTNEGNLINSGNEFNGLSSKDAMNKIIDKLESNSKGSRKISYRLKDWNFSRQRYWGEPIPIYFPVEILSNDQGLKSPLDGAPYKIHYSQPIPVEESELPLKLPEMENFHPGSDPQGCLARAKEWRFFQKNGQWFARETNTMPQWAGSCWYYLRFIDPKNTAEIFSKKAAKDWLPVDLYVGGQEHAVLHLLYARFWHKALYDIGVVDHVEPFTKLVHQGMILGSDGEKMSKSRGNVINPDDIIQEYGADALRLYEMFMGPLEAVKPWQTEQLLGVVRFRDRIYNLVQKQAAARKQKQQQHQQAEKQEIPLELLQEMHKTIKKVSEDLEKMSFNTAISSLMVYSNTLRSYSQKPEINDSFIPLPNETIENLILLISPIAPHLAEECWSLLGHAESLAYHPWPTYEEKYCEQNEISLAIQINGKVRTVINISKELTEEKVMELVLENPQISKRLQDKKILKKIYVPGKIVNIIIPK